eukprot:4308358-Prymnesium_polylepis.1
MVSTGRTRRMEAALDHRVGRPRGSWQRAAKAWAFRTLGCGTTIPAETPRAAEPEKKKKKKKSLPPGDWVRACSLPSER